MSMQARAMKAAGCKSTGAGRHVTSAMRWAGDRWIVLITAGAFSVETTCRDMSEDLLFNEW